MIPKTINLRNVRRLSSGAGLVYYAQNGHAFVAIVWDGRSDEREVLRRVEFHGLGDMRVARQAISGFVDSYAASN